MDIYLALGVENVAALSESCRCCSVDNHARILLHVRGALFGGSDFKLQEHRDRQQRLSMLRQGVGRINHDNRRSS